MCYSRFTNKHIMKEIKKKSVQNLKKFFLQNSSTCEQIVIMRTEDNFLHATLFSRENNVAVIG